MTDAQDRAASLAKLIREAEPFIVPKVGSAGKKQVVKAQVKGQVSHTGAGNVKVTTTADGLAGSPLLVSVPVSNDDSASQVAGKIRTALAAVVAIAELFAISGIGVNVILTATLERDNDSSLNVAIDNDTSAGLTPSPTSTITVKGEARDTEELEAFLDDNRVAVTWSSGLALNYGDSVLPTVRNGRVYTVIQAGMTGAAEPVWPTGQNIGVLEPYDSVVKSTSAIYRRVTDGTVIYEDAGSFNGSIYDVDMAARDVWDNKASIASQYVSTPGVDMASIYKRCIEMRDRYEPVLIG